MNIRKIRNKITSSTKAFIEDQSVRRIARMTSTIILQTVVAIAIFNLLGQGLIAHAVTLLYFYGMMIVLDEEMKKEAVS